jgi:hypothetical protein
MDEVDGQVGDGEEVEEIGERVFYSLQPTQVKRTMNYTDVAYTSLLRACESVSF